MRQGMLTHGPTPDLICNMNISLLTQYCSQYCIVIEIDGCVCREEGGGRFIL